MFAKGYLAYLVYGNQYTGVGELYLCTVYALMYTFC